MSANLRTHFRTFYFIGKLFALNPFRLDESGQPQFSLIGNIYCLLAAGLYGCYHIDSTLRNMARNAKDTTEMVRTLIEIYNQFAGCFILVLIILTSVLRQRKIMKSVRIFHEIDKLFEDKFKLKINNVKWLRNIIFQICISLSILSVMEHQNCLMFIRDTSTYTDNCMIMCFIPMFMNVISEIQFIGYLSLIRSRFDIINFLLKNYDKNNWHSMVGEKNDLEIIIEERGAAETNLLVNIWRKTNAKTMGLVLKQRDRDKGFVYNSENLTIIQDICNRLRIALDLITTVYGVQTILLLIVQFTTMTSLGYDICMQIVSYKDQSSYGKLIEKIFTPSLWIAIHFIEMFAICFYSHVTVNEANKVSRLVKISSFDNGRDTINLLNSIKRFHLKAIYYKYEISPCGLITLDLNLLFTMIGAVTTYLIILIQFDISTRSQSLNSTAMTALAEDIVSEGL